MKKNSFLLLLLCFTGLCSCKKEIDHFINPSVNIYVAGYQNQGNGYFAEYWKNTNGVILDDASKFGVGSSIFVSEGDVYVAGEEHHIATYWKNGVPVFPDSTTPSAATSIVVSGADVYVAGTEFPGGSFGAVYWKNGNVVSLTDGSEFAIASSIAVSGSDVYVAGVEGN